MTPEGIERAKQLVKQIEWQIAEAEEYGNGAEACRLRETREEVVAYIAKARGLSGRGRKVGDPNEKARKSVAGAIRYTLSMMGLKTGNRLAGYLHRQTIRGLFCSFRRDTEIDWKVFM